MYKYLSIAILTLLPLCSNAQTKLKSFQTQSLSKQIQSLSVHRDAAQLTPPVMELGNQSIEVSFDDLDWQNKQMYYRVVLCNANWTEAKDIPTNKYIIGFRENPINDYQSSFNTNIPYVHYSVKFPNNDVKFKSSGNYALQIYDLDNPDYILAIACFSIVESKANVSGKVTPIVQKTAEGNNQHLNFSLNFGNINMSNTDKNLKIAIIQNNRLDDVRWMSKPTYNKSREFTYDNEPNLYFKGGNEFRRFNITSTKFTGINIAQINFIDGFYHFDLLRDLLQSGKNSYTYSPDNNGKVYYTLENDKDVNTEAEYSFVHFYLYMKDPFLQGGIYLSGDLTNGLSPENKKMDYNFDSKCYEKTMLLKQGAYEYQYLYMNTRDGETIYSSEKTEGNYWQTENQYSIYVYYRPLGELYDHLLGFGIINSTTK